jgi:hypothetical protein
MTLKAREKLSIMCLTLSLFFNPLGFDIIQWELVQWTGGLWKANAVLYCIAGLFFGFYILLRRKIKQNDK